MLAPGETFTIRDLAERTGAVYGSAYEWVYRQVERGTITPAGYIPVHRSRAKLYRYQPEEYHASQN